MLPRLSPEIDTLPELTKQDTSPEKSDKELKREAYDLKMASRISQWKSGHEKEPFIRDNPPIHWDSSINDFVWLNRGIRRQK